MTWNYCKKNLSVVDCYLMQISWLKHGHEGVTAYKLPSWVREAPEGECILYAITSECACLNQYRICCSIRSWGGKIGYDRRDGERKRSFQFSPKAQSVSEEAICSSEKRGSQPVFLSEGSQTYRAEQQLGRKQFWRVAKRLQWKESRHQDS